MAKANRFTIAEQHNATGVLIGVYGTYSTYEEADAACRLANDKSNNTFCVVEIQPRKEAPK